MSDEEVWLAFVAAWEAVSPPKPATNRMRHFNAHFSIATCTDLTRWRRAGAMPFMTSSGTGLLLGFFCRFVGPRKIRVFKPLASYLTPDSELGTIKTYVLLVGSPPCPRRQPSQLT